MVLSLDFLQYSYFAFDNVIIKMLRGKTKLKTRPKYIYMGCSDVSEFEHIYGQIVTTPFCVYTMHTLHEQE